MPSTSKKQHNFMAAVAKSPAFAKKVGVSQSVGQDFNEADKGKFSKGGNMKKMNMAKADMAQDKSMMQKAVNKHEGRLHKGQPVTKLAKGGTFRASANGIATKGKTKGTQIVMKNGGMC